jgi:hypothetical protein
MDGSARPLSRRAFVRGALLTSVAAAATAVRPIAETVARGQTTDEVPRLDVHDPVVGVASRADGLLAVGGHPAAPRAWRLAPDAAAWQTVAAENAFPETTSLLDVAAHTTGYVAAGWLETATGPRPSLLTSPDGVGWTPTPLPEIGHGVCLAVAARDGAAMAIGTTFDEPDVREPVRQVAFVSDIGGAWSEVGLEGVAAPRHGAVTMLTAARGAFLLATVDVGGSALYASAAPSGPWRSVATPRSDQPVSFLAATDTAAGVLLAGIDALDRPRYWIEGSRGWRETSSPSGLSTSSHVVGFTRTSQALVAAGSDTAGSFVEEVNAA